MPIFTLNEKSIEVPQGTTILQAAKSAGVEIPHFCYHPYLSIAGNCRMCLVDIEKAPKLAISCATHATDGMIVRTDTPKAKKAVRGVLEFLLINHPIDCPVCDQAGECKLQDYYMAYGLHESRVTVAEKVKKRKALDLGPIFLDSERCVLCSRCIRYLDEVTKTRELGFFERGNRTRIASFLDSKVEANSYAGNLADVCPVGAITSKDFRFRCRVWFLKSTPSICAECSTGCNVRVDHRDGQVFRFVPRINPFVNKTWLCDAGRYSYRNLNGSGRLLFPAVRKDGALQRHSWNECMNELSGKLSASSKSGAKPLVILSSRLSNEELYLAKKIFTGVGGSLRVLGGTPDETSAMEDFLLRRKDHTANSTGARKLGIEVLNLDAMKKDILGTVTRSRYSLLVTDVPEILEGCPADLPLTIVLSTHESANARRADIVLPCATHVEKEGTFTNFEGRVQKADKAFPPPGEARPTIEIFLELSRILGNGTALAKTSDAIVPAELFSHISKEIGAFAGLGYGSLAEYGAVLK